MTSRDGGTGFSGLTLNMAVCACCATHNDRPLTTDIVMCATCGASCSCEGCVAECADPSIYA